MSQGERRGGHRGAAGGGGIAWHRGAWAPPGRRRLGGSFLSFIILFFFYTQPKRRWKNRNSNCARPPAGWAALGVEPSGESGLGEALPPVDDRLVGALAVVDGHLRARDRVAVQRLYRSLRREIVLCPRPTGGGNEPSLLSVQTFGPGMWCKGAVEVRERGKGGTRAGISARRRRGGVAPNRTKAKFWPSGLKTSSTTPCFSNASFRASVSLQPTTRHGLL